MNTETPIQPNFVCINPIDFNRSVSEHETWAKELNARIIQYEAVFDQEITQNHFDLLKNNEVNSLKEALKTNVYDRINHIKSPIKREAERKFLMSDSHDFFNIMVISHIGGRITYFDVNRLRLVEGKAVFDKSDAQKLLEDRYSVDTNGSGYAGLFDKFEAMKEAYDDFCQYLVENKETIKINPRREAIIRDSGLISISFNTREMILNTRSLSGRHWVD
jgi:hypothetical protein